jgi:hypothetical protein
MLPDLWWIHCVATDVRSGGMSPERTQAVSPVWVKIDCAVNDRTQPVYLQQLKCFPDSQHIRSVPIAEVPGFGNDTAIHR